MADQETTAVVEETAKPSRVPFPNVPENGFETSTPDGWDGKKHTMLRKGDFAHPKFYYAWRADLSEAQMNNFRAQAELAEQLGDPETLKKARRLANMKRNIAALMTELEEDPDVDLDLILNKFGG